MSSPMTTVLITGVGGPAGRSLCAQLRALHPAVTIIGTDIRDVTADTDLFVPGHHATDPEHVPSLQALITDYDVDLLVPTVQDELPIIAAQTTRLAAPVVISDARAVQICHDKLLTARYLQSCQVSVPWTRDGTQPPLDYPYVARPRVSRGGRGVAVIDTPDQTITTDPALLLQGFAPGIEYCPQIYRSPVTGEMFIAVLEKTELKQGRVGNAAGVRRIPDTAATDIVDLARRATEALDLYGPLDMDIRRQADGCPVVLEVNARFGANSAHTPELLERLLTDATHLAPNAQPTDHAARKDRG